MELKSAKHKAIKAMLAGVDHPKGMGARDADLIRLRLSALAAAANLQEVTQSFPGWRVHALKGPFAGFWSIDVTGNWRLIFRMDRAGVLTDLDYRDTH
jgi:toxin HigB-1